MVGHWIPIHTRQIYQGFFRGPKELDNKKLSDLCMQGADKIIDKNINATGIEDSKIPDDPEVDRLKSYLHDEMWNMIDPRLKTGEVWGHILQPGDHTQIHSHYNKKDWARIYTSWVYYPQIPTKGRGGRIVFQFQSHADGINYQIQPEVGMYIMFPSWLSHYTTRHSGDEIRISISGNMRADSEEQYQMIIDDKHSGVHEFMPRLGMR